MKKMSVVIAIMFSVLIICGCGASESGQTKAQPEEQATVTHYTENQTEMGNYMIDAYACIDNGWVYTYGWGADTNKPLFLKMRTDGTDDTVLHYYEGPSGINIKGEYIYSVLSYDTKPSIYRFRLGGEDEKKIVDGAMYLSIVGDTLYYCRTDDGEKTTTFNSCDLDGKNEKVVLDKEVYYPYVVDDAIFYQDDDDNETIHRYDIDSKEDIKITQEKTYGYILNDDYMYCLLNDGSTVDGDNTGYLAKVNLDSFKSETLYDGADTWGFNIKDDTIYFINANDENRIYSISKEGENISLVTQDDYCWPPCIYGDKMIYIDSHNYEYVDELFICDLDGSNKKSLRKNY